MNFWDWSVIVLYIAVIIGIALLLTPSQRNLQDYYLAGKKIKWWQSGLSTMATQLGAISFVSAPAFVALKEGGGLKWLCYELGVPLGLILVMGIIIPTLHQGRFISIYEYLETRFDSSTRSLVSFLFQMGRGLATAVAVLAGGLILSTALAISTTSAIILVGLVTIIYDVLGGIRVVILSDVLQMMIIMVGIIICVGVALNLVGWSESWSLISSERLKILDFQHWGFSPEGKYGFWPMVIGGIFLYASYYGCDQSQVQRELTVKNVEAVRKSLLINALGRFPVVLMYCLMGIFVGAVVTSPESLSKMGSVVNLDKEAISQMLKNDPDRMVPLFILSFLPHGLIGFIFVAIMSALMSSLDSALNSLSAVTIRDFYQKYFRPDGDDRHYLIASKVCTLFWGIFCVSAAIIFANFGGSARQTTIVLINAVGSLLYGPILAAFVLGMITDRITSRAIKIGIILGVLANAYLWLFTPISWLWWNLFGFLVVVFVSTIFSIPRFFGEKAPGLGKVFYRQEEGKGLNWKLIYIIVVFYFFMTILLCYLIGKS
jgi:SSS family transporter